MSLELCAALADAGVFADIDRYFAASMVDLGADANVALSAATVSAMHRAGHTCLPLSAAGRLIVEVVDGPFAGDGAEPSDAVRRIRLPTLSEWQETLAASPVVMNGSIDGPTLPLVLDANRLYLHRLFDAERRLAERLLALAARPAAYVLDGALSRVFGGNPELEAVAAARAAMGQLCIVTGGPGTGKTTLAASLIALACRLGPSQTRPHRARHADRQSRRAIAGSCEDAIGCRRPAFPCCRACELRTKRQHRPSAAHETVAIGCVDR